MIAFNPSRDRLESRNSVGYLLKIQWSFDLVVSQKLFEMMEEEGVVDNYKKMGVTVKGCPWLPPNEIWGMTPKGQDEVRRLKRNGIGEDTNANPSE